MLEHPINQVDVVYGHLPDGGSPFNHLVFDVLGTLVSRPTGGEGDAAASGEEGVTHRIGVGHSGVNVFGGNAQDLRRLHGYGDSSSPDVGGTFHQTDGPVGIDADGATGLETDVEPEAGGHPAAPVWSFQGSLVLFGVAGRFQNFNVADTWEHRAVHPPGSLLGGVEQPHFDGVQPQLLAYFVHHRFASESGVGGGRRPVGSGLGLVHHDVVAIDPHVFYVVGSEDALSARRYHGTGISAGLVGQVGFSGGNFARLIGPHFDLDVGAGGRSGAFKHLGSGHGKFHGRAGLFGQQSRRGFQINRNLAAKAAADLHGHHFDFGNRQVEDGRQGLSDSEGTLSTAPDGQGTVGVPQGSGILGLNVSLMNRGGGVLVFDDYVGLGETLVHVA